MIKVVSFDIGNTIIKTTNKDKLSQLIRNESIIENEQFNEAYKEHFIRCRISLDEFCTRTLISKDKILEIIRYYRKEKKPAEVWDDVRGVLSRLRKDNIEIIVLSNKTYVNPYTMKNYGLDKYFNKEIYSCNVGYEKPDSRIFSYAAKDIACVPKEIIHVGDSFNADYLGAIQAGWKALLLDRERKFEKTEAVTDKITKLEELFNYL